MTWNSRYFNWNCLLPRVTQYFTPHTSKCFNQTVPKCYTVLSYFEVLKI